MACNLDPSFSEARVIREARPGTTRAGGSQAVERVPRRGPTPHRGSRQERNVDLGAGRERSCVTAMTLMTLIYGLILDEGVHLVVPHSTVEGSQAA